MYVDYKRELRVEMVYNALLYAVFISFALALSNIKFISEIFMGLRWLILFVFLFFGLFIDKWKINKKNLTSSEIAKRFYAKKKIAEKLNLSVATLYNKIKKYDLAADEATENDKVFSKIL